MEDPPGEAPWAMQLVARVERSNPPRATAVLEASATAVVALLAHPDAAPGGAWQPEVERWLAGRIRKLARRARGVAWERVQAIPGVTVQRGGAEVRAFVPGPTDRVPADIHKLQLQGFALDDDDRVEGPLQPGPGELVIARNPEVDISLGKAAAQVGHASNLTWLGISDASRQSWAASGFPLRVVAPAPAPFRMARATATVTVVDAGYTELDGPTLTCIGMWGGCPT